MKSVFLILYLFTAVLEDFQSRKVANQWIIFGIVIAVLAIIQDKAAPAEYILGFMLPFIFLFFFYCIRVIGAGDIKLFMVTGLFLGQSKILLVMFWAFVFGGIYAVIKLFRTKGFRRRFTYFINYMSHIITKKSMAVYVDGSWDEEMVMHFSVCILLGTLPVIGGMA